MSAPIEKFLAAFGEHGLKPKRAGTNWSCRCPGHDDRSPSLSISLGTDGRVLLKCHAGCSVDVVCAAVGLSPADLFPSGESHSGRAAGSKPRRRSPKTGSKGKGSGSARDHPQATFASAGAAVAALEIRLGHRSMAWTYHNAAGEPVGMVVRWDRPNAKKIILPVSLLPDKGWGHVGMADPRPLYRLPELLALPKGARVYVTEGEKSAEGARSLNLVVTTSPHGAESAGQADWSVMADKEVEILVDHDDAGEKYGREVADACLAVGAASVRIVRLVELWPRMPKGGDIVDLIEHRGGDVPSVRAEVEGLVDRTPLLKVAPRRVDGEPVILRMSEVEPREVCWLWEGRIPRGRLSLLAGRPGEGKSMATMDFAARVTTGHFWPDRNPCERGSVVLVAGEDDPHDTIRPRLDAHGADPSRVHLLQAVVRVDKEGGVTEGIFTLADLGPLEETLKRVPDCSLVIIDPIGSFIGGEVDSDKDNKVRAILGPLAALAQKTGAAILMVAHQRKGTASHADDLVMGSRAFTGIARSVLHLMLDPNDDTRRLLLPGKRNLSSPAPGLAFTINGKPARIEWEPDPVEFTADGLLSEQAHGDEDGRIELEDAVNWLRSYLLTGPKLAVDVIEQSKAAAFSKRTLDRAKKALGVRTTKQAFGGGWVWSLAQGCQVPSEGCHVPESGNLGVKPAENRKNRPKVAKHNNVATFDGSGNLRLTEPFGGGGGT